MHQEGNKKGSCKEDREEKEVIFFNSFLKRSSDKSQGIFYSAFLKKEVMRNEPGPFLNEELWKASSKASAHFSASTIVDKQRATHNPGLFLQCTLEFTDGLAERSPDLRQSLGAKDQKDHKRNKKKLP
jgi:hypothetical protein